MTTTPIAPNPKDTLNDLRSEPRLYEPAVVIIDQQHYLVSDWSPGGFRIQYFSQPVQVGDCLPISFNLHFQGGVKLCLDSLVEVVWKAKDTQAVGFRFLNLRDSERLLINQAIDNLKKQEIVLEDYTLSGATPDEKITNLTALKQHKRPPILLARRVRSVFIILCYLILGGTITFFTLSNLAYSVKTMEIKSSVVAKSVKPIITNRSGTIRSIYVKQGETIQKNQLLLDIYDQDLVQSAVREEINDLNSLIRNKVDNIDGLKEKILLARLELGEAQQELKTANFLKHQEEKDLRQSEQIARQDLKAAQEQIRALSIQHESAQAIFERATLLEAEGAISQERVDEAKARLAKVAGELATAKANAQKAQTILTTLQKGSVYNDARFKGNLPRLTEMIQNAQHKVHAATEKISLLESNIRQLNQEIRQVQQKKERLLNGTTSIDQGKQFLVPYSSPIAGTVLKINEMPGSKVRGGDTLLLLEQKLDQAFVEAYLTKDQAALITVGTAIAVNVPQLKQEFMGTVTEIDYRGGFRDDLRGRYQFEGSEQQPVYVKVQLQNLNPTVLDSLKGDLPVILKVTKKVNLWETWSEQISSLTPIFSVWKQ